MAEKANSAALPDILVVGRRLRRRKNDAHE